MQRSKRKKGRRRRIIWGSLIGFLVCIGACGFFFRNTLLYYGIHAGASWLYPGLAVEFQSVEWQGRELVLTQVNLEGPGWAFEANRLTVVLDFDFKRHLFKPRVLVSTAFVDIHEQNAFSISPYWLQSSPYLQLECTLEGGALRQPGKAPLHFTFHKSGVQGGVLTVFKSEMCNDILFSGTWMPTERGVEVSLTASQLSLDEVPSSFWAMVPALQENSSIVGQADLTVAALVGSSGKVEQVSGTMLIENGSFSDPTSKLELSAKRAEVAFFQLEGTTHAGHLSFEEGKAQLGAITELAQLSGDLDWKETKGLTGILEGVIIRDAHYQPFHLEAKGEADGSWQGKIAFENKDSPELDCLYERRDGEYQFCSAFENIGPDVIDLIQDVVGHQVPEALDWECTEGGFSGKIAVTFSESGGLGIKVHELIGRGIKVQNLSQKWLGSIQSCYLKGMCGLQNGNFELDEIDLCFEKGAVDIIRDDGEIWNLSQLIGHVAYLQGRWKQSFIQGAFLGIEGEVTLKGPSLFDQGSFNLRGTADQFIALLSQDLADAFHLEEDVPVQVAGHISEKGIHAKCVMDGSAQGALMWHIPTEYYTGAIQGEKSITFQANRMSPAIAGPLLKMAGIEVKEGCTSVTLSGAYGDETLKAQGHISLAEGDEPMEFNWALNPVTK